MGQLFATDLSQTKEWLGIALGIEAREKPSITVTDNGRAIHLDGKLVSGTAHDTRSQLNAVPGATTLVLTSPGGRLFETESLAALDRERGLNTHVEGTCQSACTLILLAGNDRTVTRAFRGCSTVW